MGCGCLRATSFWAVAISRQVGHEEGEAEARRHDVMVQQPDQHQGTVIGDEAVEVSMIAVCGGAETR